MKHTAPAASLGSFIRAEVRSWSFWGAVAFSLIVVLRLLPEFSNPRFSWIGDEWSFWDVASEINAHGLLVNPFSAGAHGYCSKLVSHYSALFLALFGQTMWNWRLSTTFVIPIATVLLYLWATQLYDRRVALFSAIIFSSSFAFQNFFPLGYGNQLTLVPFLLLNILLTAHIQRASDSCTKRQLLIHSALTGSVLGIGFYFYIGIILPFIFLPYWFFIWVRHGSRATVMHALACLISASLWLIPLLFDDSYGDAVVGIFEYHHRGIRLIERAPMIGWTFLAFFDRSGSGYFVAGPFLDHLSATLLIVGLCTALYTLRKLPSSSILLMQLVIFLGVLGLSHSYADPPFQRCFVLLTLSSILAGYGLTLLLSFMPTTGQSISALAILSAVVLANQYRRELSVFKHGISPEACLLMNVIEHRLADPDIRDIYVRTNNPAFPQTVRRNLFPHYGISNLELHFIDLEAPDEQRTPTITLNSDALDECRRTAVPSFLLDIFNSPWADLI